MPRGRCAAPRWARPPCAPQPARLHRDSTADRADLLPLGHVATTDGDRLAGVRLADTFFGYHAGRSRFAKTETLIGQFVHLAPTGHGCFFLDHQEDARNRIKLYLTDVTDRVVEINLAPRGLDHRSAGWNLFSMEHRTPGDTETLISAVVDRFASALR